MSKFGHTRGLIIQFLLKNGTARSSEIREAIVAQYPEAKTCATTAINDLFYDGLVSRITHERNAKWKLR
jgi:predicted transcriptional regulator